MRQPVDRSREADEKILRMVRRRSVGWTVTQIQRTYATQMSAANVDAITNRIREDDLRECQTVWPGDDPASVESEDVVMAGYWKRLRAPRRHG